ncbi:MULTISPECIES: PH domain-containing protein [Bacillus]|uniref:PH domain-containing protein n=1 Tax=Bacillus TaxID=1386 RepID=UPI001F0AD394|nr:PH domain-containing protein [Bacillus pseudomycoides]MCR8861002.1 PH domain-containing protein [Bacillus pseudomycoides]MED1537962.1 PH domain-containing protein [Bacillus pseudomycoides]
MSGGYNVSKIKVEITIIGEYSTFDGLVSEAEKLPKTNREHYRKVLNLLKKEAEGEKFYFLSTGAFKGTTFGYLFFTDTKVILVEVKPPFGKLKTHVYEYKNYDEVDYDMTKALGITNNMIYLNKSGLFGSKKDRVTHISSPKFMEIYEFVKMHIK